MKFTKKLTGFLIAALCLVPFLGQAYTINGNLDVRGNINGGIRRLGANNLSLNLTSGTLKIQCGNADCSTSNPGWITLPHGASAGILTTYKITTSPTFGDATAGDSDFVGTGTCSWGTTAGVAWGNDMPILIGAFHDGTTVVFGLARGPVFTTGASTNIGYQDNCPSSASQSNVIAMTSSNVTASHASKRFTPIGAIRITKNSSDNYTFTALDSGDGIDVFYNFGQRAFSMPAGQNGATSGKYINDFGGTAPVFSTNNYFYQLDKNGICRLIVELSGDGGTDGATAVQANVAMPYANNSGTGSFYLGSVLWSNASAQDTAILRILSGSSVFNIVKDDGSGVNNSDFPNGNRSIGASLQYPAF